MSVPKLLTSLFKFRTFSVLAVSSHHLLDIGTLKSICSPEWLTKI